MTISKPDQKACVSDLAIKKEYSKHQSNILHGPLQTTSRYGKRQGTRHPDC